MSGVVVVECFGVRLERRATQRGLRAQDVAARGELHPKRVRRLMSGQCMHGPTLAEIETLARVLSVRPGWLAFGDDR